MPNVEKYKVTIEYCSHCNFRAQAIRVSDELLSNYQHIIDQVIINTGSKGVFDVKVNEQMIFSKYKLDRHAEPDEVLKLFREVVGPEVPVYPQ